MRFTSPLVQGTLVKRYKRFLADVRMENGEIITVHCPNTGTMLSCSTPDSPVCLSRSDNPKRKYPFTLEMVKDNSTWVGVNTARTNKLVVEAIENGQIAEFLDIKAIKTEIKTSDHTRLDLLVSHGNSSTYIEVKNCSLAVDGCAMFPDAITKRGTKHLHELTRLTAEGMRTCIFFLVQRMDANQFSPASHIDSIYDDALLQAAEAGVMVLVYQAEVSPKGIDVVGPLPHSLLRET
ncbi:MAG: DNA/RNA nuclease SfsA [Desulforhopalus sp.]|nr:DNA/RNA nuclease SfsA [Desulforhopalus sp.]